MCKYYLPVSINAQVAVRYVITQCMKCLFLLLLPSIAMASIFDTDDRLDFYEIKDPIIREMTKSTPTLVRKEKMIQLSSGDFKMIGKSLSNTFKFCSDANFASQPHNGNCSSALISKDRILTAAHCIDKSGNYGMSAKDYYVVFDYKRTDKNMVEYIIPKENVYTIKKEIYRDFDRSMFETAIDLTILKLDRKVNRPILKVNTKYKYVQGNEVFVIGYPLGIPLKLTPNGFINNKKASKNSFKHDLDTFSVNSGSPVFDAETKEIMGVHVRGTGWNYDNYGRECKDWFVAERGKDWGEANTLHVLDGKI